jgi:hypothetical protein
MAPAKGPVKIILDTTGIVYWTDLVSVIECQYDTGGYV